MVSKLKPKSTSDRLALVSWTVLIDCGVVVLVASAASVVLALPASASAGFSPPT